MHAKCLCNNTTIGNTCIIINSVTLFSPETNMPSSRSSIYNMLLVCSLTPSPTCVFQMLRFGRRAGIDTKAAVPRGLYHPATDFMGRHTSAVLDAGGLGMQQKLPQPTKSCPVLNPRSCSPSLQGLGPESRSADLESDASVEGAARCGDLAAREEGSEQLISSASDPKPAAPEEEWLQGSVPGTVGCMPVCPCPALGHTHPKQSDSHGCWFPLCALHCG